MRLAEKETGNFFFCYFLQVLSNIKAQPQSFSYAGSSSLQDCVSPLVYQRRHSAAANLRIYGAKGARMQRRHSLDISRMKK
jgi:hypothetical protein